MSKRKVKITTTKYEKYIVTTILMNISVSPVQIQILPAYKP